MHIVAPLVITLGLSFVLYREKGKWNPIALWPKEEYDAWIARDPIKLLEERMRAEKTVPRKRINEIGKEVTQ